ncbi:Alkaline protease 2 [Zancudomyces culisetae]|uniref:Alkaline protease 2 n=1 Tax=Zancudomyces culisetae TaxID=1213189 RepID=A0A1R1PI21_ZANCU|nr:Alkaline protease 2 [Zancudomyces culisetae]|eukprot:OMH80598.1 Alkaline protease 2 [Zancudomyces culisetae]
MKLRSLFLVYLSVDTALGIATSITNSDRNNNTSINNIDSGDGNVSGDGNENIGGDDGGDVGGDGNGNVGGDGDGDSDDRYKYIVVLKPGVKPSDSGFIKHFEDLNLDIAKHNAHNIYPCNALENVYEDSIVGYSGVFSDHIVDSIKNSDIVEYVEKDIKVSSSIVQTSSPWGLARISHRKKLTAQTYQTYLYNSRYYQNATVYILDTGINLGHQEFEGRASWGATFARNSTNVDDNGHGTHVAGIVGGKTYGVAKKANLVAVKVLNANGTGYISDVIAGINYVLSRVKAQNSATVNGSVAVTNIINMSLGGSFSAALNQVINSSTNSGVLFISSAGNSNDDACKYSPASANGVIAVGAMDIRDSRASFSCYGACVNIFAPGKSIVSAFRGSNTATAVYSGTSMASPHISGLAAYYIMTSQNKYNAQQLYNKVLSSGTKGVLSNIGAGSPNLLGYNSISG